MKRRPSSSRRVVVSPVALGFPWMACVRDVEFKNAALVGDRNSRIAPGQAPSNGRNNLDFRDVVYRSRLIRHAHSEHTYKRGARFATRRGTPRLAFLASRPNGAHGAKEVCFREGPFLNALPNENRTQRLMRPAKSRKALMVDPCKNRCLETRQIAATTAGRLPRFSLMTYSTG